MGTVWCCIFLFSFLFLFFFFGFGFVVPFARSFIYVTLDVGLNVPNEIISFHHLLSCGVPRLVAIGLGALGLGGLGLRA